MSDYINPLSASSRATSGTTLYDQKDRSVMGKEDFLMLLVEQLKNQDPTNPEDATEFTSQLTEFSSLEQLENLNTSMDSLIASNQNSDKISTLGTIGKDVAYKGSEISYSGESVGFGYLLNTTAAEVTITLSQNGGTVATLEGTELSAGNHFLSWDGLTDDGEQAPVGDYDISISATDSAGASVAVTSLIRSEVTGVDLGGTSGGTLITVAGEIPFSSIIGVFEPGSYGDSSAATDDEKESDEESVTDTVDEAVDTVEDAVDATETIVDAVT
ncbi:flagellar hook assembly protein FlgD [Desulforhopalus sp. 52FAK]